ncbi:unnamed protein product [Clavelina lepadiformis]|uniref:Uncharacterized protein n=1 Tax=Clavelina lepadiformis TaxID=159417 RepID=A0ABP0G922_CLALP
MKLSSRSNASRKLLRRQLRGPKKQTGRQTTAIVSRTYVECESQTRCGTATNQQPARELAQCVSGINGNTSSFHLSIHRSFKTGGSPSTGKPNPATTRQRPDSANEKIRDNEHTNHCCTAKSRPV